MRVFQAELRGLCYCNAADKGNPIVVDWQIVQITFKGIVCRHIITVLNCWSTSGRGAEVKRLPETYILRHWRKDIRRIHTCIPCSYDQSVMTKDMQRYKEVTEISRLCNDMSISKASGSQFEWWKEYLTIGLEKLTERIREFSCKSACDAGTFS